MIQVGDTVEWKGDAIGGSHRGMVIDRDEVGMGTPALLLELADRRWKRLPEKCCRKVVRR